MTDRYDPKAEDAELWSRAREACLAPLRESADAPGAAPDPLVLAAYLDGTLDPLSAERVEAWMAGSPDALDLVIAAREALVASPAPAPQGLVERARGLVRARPARASGDGLLERIGRWLVPGYGLGRSAAWAGLAAALLLSAAGSFELGQFGVRQLAAAEVQEADELGLGLGQPLDELL